MSTDNIKEKFAAVMECLLKNNADEAKRLLSRHEELTKYSDDSGRMAAHWAASGGCLPIMKFLLSQDPALISKTDDSGWTVGYFDILALQVLLMISSSAGHTDNVKFLLSFAETDVNHRNNNGQTSLHYACSKSHEDIARLLVENGADVNAQDNYGASPLHRAACKGNEKIVRLLLDCKRIRVNIADKTGNMPLHCACEDENESIAIYLVKKGADLHAQNKEEKTALDLVRKAEFRRKLEAEWNNQKNG